MAKFFTSDTHFNHINIIAYCNRPFVSVLHMNEGLILAWNSVVNPEDTVYHIGDFAMGDRDQIPSIRARLNGKIILITGNHDLSRKGVLLRQIAGSDFEVHNELNITVDGIPIYLRHTPNMDFVPTVDARFHICGHVHNSWIRKGNILNAGVDVNMYQPVSLHRLIEKTLGAHTPVKPKGLAHILEADQWARGFATRLVA